MRIRMLTLRQSSPKDTFMANIFIDLSSLTNGNGTLGSPYNVFSTGILSSGNTYWLRRTVHNGVTNNTIVTIPKDVNLIGWPLPGDRFYADRPVNPTWDADVETHCTIEFTVFSYVTMVSVTGIYISRISLIAANTVSSSAALGIRVDTCSRIAFENLHFYRRTTAGISSGSLGVVYVLNSTQVFLEGCVFTRGNDNQSNGLPYLRALNVTSMSVNATLQSIPLSGSPAFSTSMDNAFAFDNCNLLRANIVFAFTVVRLFPCTVFVSGNDIIMDVRAESVLDLTGLQGGLTTGSLLTNSTITFNMPHTSFIDLNDDGSNDITIITNSLNGMNAPSATTATVDVSSGTSVKILPRDGTSVDVALGQEPATLKVVGTGDIYVQKLTGLQVPSVPITESPLVQYYDDNGIYRCRNASSTARSTSISRIPSGASIEVTALQAAPLYYGRIGSPNYTPFVYDVPFAGSYNLRYYLAGRGGLGQLRPGFVFMKARWTDGKGLDVAASGDLHFTGDTTWTGITGYEEAYLEVVVTVDRPTRVDVYFEVLMPSAILELLYIDPQAVMTLA